MGKFREWLREAESKENIKEETEYQKFFAKKLEKYSVTSPAELSDEDKKKFFDEIEAEWEGEKEEISEEISEGIRGSSLSERDFKEFSKLLTERVKLIKDEMKDGHVGDIAGLTESFANDLLKWVKKLKQSDIR